MTISTTRPGHDTDWGVTHYTYPDAMEATAWKGIRYGNKKGKQKDPEKTTREEMDPETLAAAISRARKTVRVKCSSIGADHLLTLTYRENMQDLTRGWNNLKYCLKLMRQGGWEGHYVVVAEKQKRGAWHFHLALSGRQDVKAWRATWRHVVGEYDGMPGGNIDVQGPKEMNRRGITNSAQLASYLSKYISKGLDLGEFATRRYRTSINIEVKKTVRYCSVSINDSVTVTNLERVYYELSGELPRTTRYIPEREIIWFASWDDSYLKIKRRIQ